MLANTQRPNRRRIQLWPAGSFSRRAPALSAVEAFVVAARCLNFRLASERLSLSPSALTRRIQQLEAYVGQDLFERHSNGVSLTPRGIDYLSDVEPPLRAMQRAAYVRSCPDPECRVRIALSRSLATNWLSKRLATLKKDTGVELEVHVSRNAELLRDGAVDMAIWGALQSADDLLSTVLFNAEAVAVGAAGDPADVELNECRLLSVASPQGMWQRWLQAPRCNTATQIVEFETLQLTYEAALEGLGVALAIPLVSEPHLRDRRLRAVCSVRRPLNESYRLYFSSLPSARDACVSRVSEWLRREVERSCRDFDSWWEQQRQLLPAGDVNLLLRQTCSD